MCIQCVMIAASAIGVAGVVRDRVVARLDAIEESSSANPLTPPMLFLLLLAAMIEHESTSASGNGER